MENGVLDLFILGLPVDVGQGVGGLFAAANGQHLNGLPLQGRVPLTACHLAEQRLRLRRLILCQNEERPVLKLF